MRFFFDSILFSYAQIFFSASRWFGGAVLLATFVIPDLGLVALLGAAISNATALVLKFDETRIRSGFYGFNGILFGAASVYFFELSLPFLLLVMIFIVITFFVSSVIEHHFQVVFNLPGLSLPFIVTLYLFLVFLTNIDYAEPKGIAFLDYGFLGFIPPWMKSYFQSLALIVFQSSVLSGIVIAGSLLVLSRVMFVLSVVGFAASSTFLHLILPYQAESLTVLAGFNAILTAFALGGNLIIPSRKSLLLTIVGALMVVILTASFMRLLGPLGLPVLVLPFNFIVLSVLYSLKFRREQSDLVLLYFQPGTPEENYYYHHARVARFARFKALLAELPFFGEWFVSQGHSGNITHKGDWRHAWDFVVIDGKKGEHANTGAALKDYYCYTLPVAAPLDGTVVRVVDSIPNNDPGEVNLKANWGNTVILDHGEGLFSAASHLEPHSVTVKEGERVQKGQIVASCGNSGRSPSPHIHFQFQTSDKPGEKTYAFPIGHYIERRGNALMLRTSGFPEAGTLVQNIETHRLIKQALAFSYGDTMRFRCELNDETFEEEWKVGVDMQNVRYIQSSRGCTAHIYQTDKVFYLSSVIGNRTSALYHFYLTAMQIPLTYKTDLQWEDIVPVSKVLANPVRYLSELLLPLGQQITARAELTFAEKSDETSDFVIRSVIRVCGSGVFSFYRQICNGSLRISGEGLVSGFDFSAPGKKRFHATVITKEDTP